MSLWSVNFSHLRSMSTTLGTYEHAEFAQPRAAHGYCTDDVARVVVVLARERSSSPDLQGLLVTSLDFLEAAQTPDGGFRNRRDDAGDWLGHGTADDWWGRAIWGLGTVMGRSTDADLRHRAAFLVERATRRTSHWPRSMAFAVLGCSEVLKVDPGNIGALGLMRAARAILDRPDLDAAWCWPEDRLRYANAALPEAAILIGAALDDRAMIERGVGQLRWLLERETVYGHLSVTPAGGRGPHDDAERFDQQPIEVAALADACVSAYEVTGDATWLAGLQLATAWFEGDNDLGCVMYDRSTGGGYDGLMADGANLNQGAESTLALLSTFQQAHRFAQVAS